MRTDKLGVAGISKRRIRKILKVARAGSLPKESVMPAKAVRGPMHLRDPKERAVEKVRRVERGKEKEKGRRAKSPKTRTGRSPKISRGVPLPLQQLRHRLRPE